MNDINPPFWEKKTLQEMSRDEWESLCDGCGLCCLVKLEDEDTGELHYTRLVCKLLDLKLCRCSDYDNRHARMSDCIKITPESLETISWLPPSCAYRLVKEGKGLRAWHPLVSGDPQSVHRAGISVRNWTLSEEGVDEQDLPDHLIENPFRRGRRDNRKRKLGKKS